MPKQLEKRQRGHTEWSETVLWKFAATPLQMCVQVPHVEKPQVEKPHDPTLMFGSDFDTLRSSLHSNDNPCCRRRVVQELQECVVKDVAELVWQYAVGYWVNVHHESQAEQQILTRLEYLRLLAYAHTNVAYYRMMMSHKVARGIPAVAAAVTSKSKWAYFGDWWTAQARVRQDYAARHRHATDQSVTMMRWETLHNRPDAELGVKIDHYTGATSIMVTPRVLCQAEIKRMEGGLGTYKRLECTSEPDVSVLCHWPTASAFGYVKGDTGFIVNMCP